MVPSGPPTTLFFAPTRRLDEFAVMLRREAVKVVQQPNSPLTAAQSLKAVIELRLVQRKGLTVRMAHWLTPPLLQPALAAYFEGQAESLKVELETDDMNRAVIHITFKDSGTLPNVVKLRDQELARALFPTVSLREVEKQLGRPLRELSYNTLVFDSSLPAVAALGDDEQLQTFVAAGVCAHLGASAWTRNCFSVMVFVVVWLVVDFLCARLGGSKTKCGREPD